GAQTIQRAAAEHEIADLQIEYSIISRGIEREILPTCRELGIAITAYGILSRGLLSDGFDPGQAREPGDIRGRLPRFAGDNAHRTLGLVQRLRAIAAARDASVQQIAIAWVSSRGDDIVPLIGARRRDQLEQALAALEMKLTDDDLEAIEQAAPEDL